MTHTDSVCWQLNTSMGLIAMNIPLKNVKFLAIDCQATGSSPKSSHLLEIGWLVFDAHTFHKKESLKPHTLLVKLPNGFELPNRITKLTGIEPAHLKNAVSPEFALASLDEKAKSMARENGLPLCPTVIHYARYERGFINALYEQWGGHLSLPFEIICTHQVANRVLPHLPRKGLRAVAGYLGHGLPKLKRCASHLVATAFIWSKLLRILSEQEGINTLIQLQHGLTHAPIPVATRSYPMPSEARSRLPNCPGVYRMKRSNGDILYIGKAKSLKQRVNSYFQSSRHHTENKLEMLTQAMDVDFTTTSSALEAALKETDEIKCFKPPYNIALTDENRQLFYVSRDFDGYTANRDEHCRLGPVPHKDPFQAANAIIKQIEREANTVAIPLLLAMPPSYCPDEDCVRLGLEIFRNKFGGLLDGRTIGQAVRHIGRVSWQARLKERDTALNTDTDEASEEDAAVEFEWTPEAVANAFESICRRCAFFLRRSRWLALLSESTIAWRSGTNAAGDVNIVQVKAGRITQYDRIDSQKPIPLPPNHPAPMAGRQMNLDLGTYDRLRVLTTEMRRLLTENRMVGIRLGHQRFMYPGQLYHLFDWV